VLAPKGGVGAGTGAGNNSTPVHPDAHIKSAAVIAAGIGTQLRLARPPLVNNSGEMIALHGIEGFFYSIFRDFSANRTDLEKLGDSPALEKLLAQ
jgi:hypothetical protein